MKNFLYFSVAISIIIISAALLYRYVIYIPNQEKIKNEIAMEKESLDNQIKCRQDGLKMYEKGKNEDTDPGISISWFEPKFIFSPNKVCYYKGGFIAKNLIMYYIYDVYKNDQLAYYSMSTINNKTEVIGDKGYYDALDAEYFK